MRMSCVYTSHAVCIYYKLYSDEYKRFFWAHKLPGFVTKLSYYQKHVLSMEKQNCKLFQYTAACSFHGKTKLRAISILGCVQSCLIIGMQPKGIYLGAPAASTLALRFLACFDDRSS